MTIAGYTSQLAIHMPWTESVAPPYQDACFRRKVTREAAGEIDLERSTTHIVAVVERSFWVLACRPRGPGRRGVEHACLVPAASTRPRPVVLRPQRKPTTAAGAPAGTEVPGLVASPG